MLEKAEKSGKRGEMISFVWNNTHTTTLRGVKVTLPERRCGR